MDLGGCDPYLAVSNLIYIYISTLVHGKSFSARLIEIEDCLEVVLGDSWRGSEIVCEVALFAVAYAGSWFLETGRDIVNAVTTEWK